MMRRLIWPGIFAGLALLIAGAVSAYRLAPRPVASAGASPLDLGPQAIEQRLREAASYLASDELQGRGPGSRGIDLAADYIARQFAAAGLKTDLLDGKPYQEFAASEHLALGPANHAELIAPDGKKTSLELGKNYTPLWWSSAEVWDLPLVFAGYGITAPRLAYDDYAGLDAAGKAVIVLRHEPRQESPGAVFGAARPTEHAYLARKLATAVEHGARCVIFCTDEHAVASRSAAGKAAADRQVPGADPLLNFRTRGPAPKRRIPVLHCRRSVVEGIIQAARGTGLTDLEREIGRALKPQSFELSGWRVAGEVSLRRERRALKNVVAVLEGRGPRAEETIVLGAHYDHLGMGGITSLTPWTSAIHHGADDNASGTAVLLELARQLAARGRTLSRRLLFVAFSAEEIGLVGSEHYVGHPLVPLKQTIAMLNLDMVGRLRRETLIVYGSDSARSFPALAKRLASRHGLYLRLSPAEFGPSDHLSFYSHNIPVLHFFTGLHEDYHSPSDVAEKLNYPGMRRVAGLVADAVTELADADERPQFSGEDMAMAEMELLSPRATGPVAGTSAYLGMRADLAHQGPGYAVAWVRQGSPADRAGLRAGDVILKWAESRIEKAGDLVAILRRKKPGERAALVITRGDTTLQVEAVLGQRW